MKEYVVRVGRFKKRVQGGTCEGWVRFGRDVGNMIGKCEYCQILCKDGLLAFKFGDESLKQSGGYMLTMGTGGCRFVRVTANRFKGIEDFSGEYYKATVRNGDNVTLIVRAENRRSLDEYKQTRPRTDNSYPCKAQLATVKTWLEEQGGRLSDVMTIVKTAELMKEWKEAAHDTLG